MTNRLASTPGSAVHLVESVPLFPLTMQEAHVLDTRTLHHYPGWVVLHLPHDATDIPVDVKDQFVVDDVEFDHEILCMTDHCTADLFGVHHVAERVARALVSWLVVDVERFEDDAREPMAAIGMGALYTHTSTCRPLRRVLNSAKRGALLEH